MDEIERKGYTRRVEEIRAGRVACTPTEAKWIEWGELHRADAEQARAELAMTMQRAECAVREAYDMAFRHFSEWNDFADAESALLLRGDK